MGKYKNKIWEKRLVVVEKHIRYFKVQESRSKIQDIENAQQNPMTKQLTTNEEGIEAKLIKQTRT